ncbi:hypothetical protein OUZ56_013014 [Daphnia magna]|uniref:Uncharacterized protein n=1 Tax=Daphnia magna TaxID=35525 RepID=A0ABQ9Z4S3_9CRUS|nr:hypothetical protein OUZ56_013014 [Daphnia magna]
MQSGIDLKVEAGTLTEIETKASDKHLVGNEKLFGVRLEWKTNNKKCGRLGEERVQHREGYV